MLIGRRDADSDQKLRGAGLPHESSDDVLSVPARSCASGLHVANPARVHSSNTAGQRFSTTQYVAAAHREIVDRTIFLERSTLISGRRSVRSGRRKGSSIIDYLSSELDTSEVSGIPSVRANGDVHQPNSGW